MANPRYLTAADVACLRRLIDAEKRTPKAAQGRTAPLPEPAPQAPDVYLAKVPPGGIPKLSGAVAGQAECLIYHEVAGILTATDFYRTVKNPSANVIPAGYAFIARDKYGTWWANAGAAATPVSTGTGTGEAPDIYLALSPPEGIAGRVGLVPGSADCAVYRLLAGAVSPAGFSETVKNFCAEPVVGSAYCEISRDAFGTWWAGVVCDTDVTPPTGTGTGTGTGNAPTCPPITISETDVRCEGIYLNLYRRTVTVNIHPVTRCLSQTFGAWGFVATVACCDKKCLETGTGTATATGTETPLWYCLGFPPETGTGTESLRECLRLTRAGLVALQTAGATVRGGPYATQGICLAACKPGTGTGTGTGTATGSGGGGTPAIAGHAAYVGNGGASAHTIGPVSLAMATGVLIVDVITVNGDYANAVTVTWGATTLSLDKSANIGGSFPGKLQTFSAPISTGTNGLTVTVAGSIGTLLVATYTNVTGLAHNAADQSVSATGAASAPDAGATGATTAANEYAHAAVGFVHSSSPSTPTWLNSFAGVDFTFQGFIGSTAMGGADGDRVLSAVSTPHAAISDVYDQWAAVCVTYK